MVNEVDHRGPRSDRSRRAVILTADMTHLQSETGAAGLWRWICKECGVRSRQWFRSRDEAVEAARHEHSLILHPEVHLYGHGGSKY